MLLRGEPWHCPVTPAEATPVVTPSAARASRSTGKALRLPHPSGRTLIVAVIALATLAMQLSAYPNHDVSWVLWGADWMLAGAKWGVDIIEPNPPLAWFLAMPSAWVARIGGFPIAATYQVMVCVAAIASVVTFDRLLHARLPTLISALFLLVFAYRDFGQREHLKLSAALTYISITTARLRGDAEPSRGFSIVIGLVAGFGFALKPYFLAAPLCVEAVVLLRERRWTAILRPETLAIGAFAVVYGAFCIAFMWDYIATVIPLARTIYWSFDVPSSGLILPLVIPIVCLGLTGAASFRRADALPSLMCAASVGFMVSFWIQHKGYSYHLLPVAAGAAISLGAALESRYVAKRLLLLAQIFLALTLLQSLTATIHWWRDFRSDGRHAIEQDRLIAAVNRYASGGKFLVVAVHPYPAFPTALYVNSSQVSRTNSQWFLPAIVELRSNLGHQRRDALLAAERNARAFILHDLMRKPDLILIDRNSARHTMTRSDFDFLAFYREDARFRKAWAPYREIDGVYGYRLFVRKRGQEQ